MKVIVIGSGLIGVTTAYFLRRRGHEVTVIDRKEGPGRETSFANGALLTPSMSDPWNAPGSWRVLLASLGRSDAAMQLRLRALPGLAGWGFTFLRNSRVATFERNALSNLRLAQYSLTLMQTLRQQTRINYGRATGSLRIFRDPTSLDHASALANRLSSEGLAFRRLSTAEAIELEPVLAPIANHVSGALHYAADETGDAYRFCVALADHARQQGVEFRFRTEVTSLELRSGQVMAAVSRRERFAADRYVVAAGSYSTPLLRRVGVRLPVRPVKGYSVTIERSSSENLQRIPILDDQLHAVVVPLEGGAIRIAGTAEFTGYDLALSPARIHNLLGLLKEVLPRATFDPGTARPWCGLRAMSADGVPIIGPTRISNLFVNTGHGHLGWTLAAGSAQLLTDLICGDSPSVDAALYAPARFTAVG